MSTKTTKLTNKDLKQMSKYFLQKYFDNIPEIPCKFVPRRNLDSMTATAQFIIEAADGYNSDEDELYGEGEYIANYVEIDDGVGFTIGGKSFSDPLNHPKLSIELADILKTDINRCVGTLLHELAHYHCWYLGYDHSDGDIPFENMLKKLNIPSNIGNRFNNITKKWEDAFDYSSIQNYVDEYMQSIKG